jgi:hypothetical protein
MGSRCVCLLVLRMWILKWAPDSSSSCEREECFQHNSLEPYLSTCVQALYARTYLLISGVKWGSEKESRNFLLSNPHNYQCHQNPFYSSFMVKWLTKLQGEMPLSPDVREILGRGRGGLYPLICLYPMVLNVLLFCKTTYHDGFTPISLCSYGHPMCYIVHEGIFFYKVVCPK